MHLFFSATSGLFTINDNEAMISSYLKIAVRSLRRHPGYAFINVTGLAVGMACVLLILLFVRDELSYDRFHENVDRIYRVTSDWDQFALPSTSPPVVRNLKSDFPEFEVGHLRQMTGLVGYEDRRFRETVLFGNPELFDVFTLSLRRGDPAEVLARPYTVVITPETAIKYFGDVDPVGRTLKFDNEIELEVTGILEPLPQNSHVHIDLLASWATLDALYDYSNSVRWGNNSIYTYILLPEDYDPETLVAQFPDFIARHAGDSWNGAVLGLQPLTRIHLHSHRNMELEANSNVAYVYVFSAIALFILLIACVNFMNLATARATERAREVGIRKVVGGRRSELIRQFLSESVLMAFAGVVLGIVLAWLVLPAFRELSGKAIYVDVLAEGFTIAALLGITLLVGILAGSYPAFVLSSFRPVAVLKGAFRTSRRGVALRKGLVVFQFATSVFLIIGTLVVFRQLEYLQEASLGFDKEQVIVVDAQERSLVEQYPAFREALLQQPSVLDVSISSEDLPSELLNGSGTTLATAPDDAGERGLIVSTRMVAVGHDFFETLGAEMAHGRSFSRAISTDSSAFILNETAARLLQGMFPDQLSTVDAAIGAELQMGGMTGELIGIVNDFNMSSLHEVVEPIIFIIQPQWFDTYLVRVAPGQESVGVISETWRSIYPEWPFQYTFADAAFEAQYRAEERLGKIFTTFSLLAIFIACLGLFGLAAYTGAQRTKEIGVRKVLGASVGGIVLLLSKDFVWLVLIAIVVAAPLAFLAMRRWLSSFAYQIEITRHADVFILAGLVAIGIAVFTMSYQSIRAALTDPAKALRSE